LKCIRRLYALAAKPQDGYLKGRFYWAKRTPENTRKALEFYQQAIDQDPNYALAQAGVADCYALLGFNPYGTMRPSEAYPRAKAAAQKALAAVSQTFRSSPYRDSALGHAEFYVLLWS